MGGAASGSWAMGEPHSEQKRRWTSMPEEPLLVYFLTGPLMVKLSLGTTVTSARTVSNWGGGIRISTGQLLTVGGTALALAVIAVVVRSNQGLVDRSGVSDRFAQTVTSKRHDGSGSGSDSRKVLKGIELRTLERSGRVFKAGRGARSVIDVEPDFMYSDLYLLHTKHTLTLSVPHQPA